MLQFYALLLMLFLYYKKAYFQSMKNDVNTFPEPSGNFPFKEIYKFHFENPTNSDIYV